MLFWRRFRFGILNSLSHTKILNLIFPRPKAEQIRSSVLETGVSSAINGIGEVSHHHNVKRLAKAACSGKAILRKNSFNFSQFSHTVLD